MCGLTGEVWPRIPEDTGSDPRAGGKFLFKKVSPAHPSVKRVPGHNCTGEQSALAVSHYSLMVLVGLQGAHTGSERHIQYSCKLLARAPGVCILHSTGTSYMLSAQVPWLDQERVIYQGSERLFAFFIERWYCLVA